MTRGRQDHTNTKNIARFMDTHVDTKRVDMATTAATVARLPVHRVVYVRTLLLRVDELPPVFLLTKRR